MDKKTKDLLLERLAKRFDEFSKEELTLLISERSTPPIEKTASPPLEPKPVRIFWLIEIWIEKRDLFKEFIGEALFVGLFLLSFEVFHRLLIKTSLEPDQIMLL